MQRNLKKSDKGEAGRAVTQIASCGFAMGEENARGHIIVTAPTAGSAGIIPAIVKSLQDLKVPPQKIRMTCDPVSGYVQVPCIERCAYGAVKAWTASCIASEAIPEERRVDLDTTISAMTLAAKEMNAKYKETSEGGLAASVVLC